MKYLVDNQMFIVCPPLPVNDFISFCRDRGVETSPYELEQLEKLGIMRPVACARKQWAPDEVDQGASPPEEVRDTEDAEGDPLDRGWYYSLRWRDRGEVSRWLEAGEVWDPADRPFEAWHHPLLNPDGDHRVDRFYSRFQCYVLHAVARSGSSTLRRLPGEWACASAARRSELLENLPGVFEEAVNRWRAAAESSVGVWQLCQAISNRYHPQTQSDERTITIPAPRCRDWDEYKKSWRPTEVAENLGVSADELFRLHSGLEVGVELLDPLKKWHDLLRFASPDKKQQLRGTALFGQMLREMEHMVRLFYNDLTGRNMYPAYDEPGWLDAMFGEGTERDVLTLLDYLTNQYHLNPRPKVLLVVEGKGEYEQFPRLVKALWGLTPGEFSIEIINLGGYANFEGRAWERLSAWQRLVDYLHHHNTIVFFVLDNHGRVEKLRRDLARVQSHHDPVRTIHKEDYFHIWRESIEFDNFSDEELASALTEAAEGQCTFRAEQVKRGRDRISTSKQDEISKLYEVGCGMERSLNKPRLLAALADRIIADHYDPWAKAEGRQELRPLVAVLRRVIDIAARNHQPAGERIRIANQRSGFLGNPYGVGSVFTE